MVHNEIHDELHPTFVTSIFDLLPIIKSTVPRVNVLVIRDIVAHVRLGGFVNGGEPDNVDTELVEIGDFG
jgi:hypothetical protein